MRCLISSAMAMFTPASAYFIEGDPLSFLFGRFFAPSFYLRNELQTAAAGLAAES
jgi:hypothetical protein